MTVLVIGASGLIGSNVMERMIDDESPTVGTYYSQTPEIGVTNRQADITETADLYSLFTQVEPSVVINCAAITDVDGCEQARDRAVATNETAAARIAKLASEWDAKLAHFSTDYVFSGDQAGPYHETDEPSPIQVYGKSKLAGENAVFKRHPDPIVVRPSFVYGIHRGSQSLTGFPTWVRDSLLAGEEVPLFTDQHVSPTRAGQVASVVCELIDMNTTGLFHVSSQSCLSPFEFGAQIAARLDSHDGTLARCSRRDIERPATRPADSCLAVDKVESALGKSQPTLQTDLESIDGSL